jgi:hypothetical protein
MGWGCGNFGGLGWSVVAWRGGEAFGRKFFGGFCESLAECFAPTVVGIFWVGDRYRCGGGSKFSGRLQQLSPMDDGGDCYGLGFDAVDDAIACDDFFSDGCV